MKRIIASILLSSIAICFGAGLTCLAAGKSAIEKASIIQAPENNVDSALPKIDIIKQENKKQEDKMQKTEDILDQQEKSYSNNKKYSTNNSTESTLDKIISSIASSDTFCVASIMAFSIISRFLLK